MYVLVSHTNSPVKTEHHKIWYHSISSVLSLSVSMNVSITALMSQLSLEKHKEKNKCRNRSERRRLSNERKKCHSGLTVVLELLGGAVTIRGGEKPPCWEAHLQLSPLSHLDRRSSLQLVIRDLSSHWHMQRHKHTHTQTVTQRIHTDMKDLGRHSSIPKMRPDLLAVKADIPAYF